MTRQKKRSNIILLIAGLLSFIPFIAAMIVNYYTVHKMGMLRHMVYLNGIWESQYPISIIKNASIVLAVLMLIMTFLLRKKKNNNAKLNRLGEFIIVDTLIALYFILKQNVDNVRAYYICAILVFIGVITINLWYYIASYVLNKENY